MNDFSDYHSRELARALMHIGAIQLRKDSPDGRGFRLALHEQNPSVPLSPIYVDLRKVPSDASAFHLAIDVYLRLLENVPRYDRLADVPTAGTPFMSVLAYRKFVPMISPRLPKTHGNRGTIAGIFTEGQKVLLIDDLITTAGSKLSAIETLESAGLHVVAVVVLIDREQGGSTELARRGCSLSAAYTLRGLLDFYRGEGLITTDEHGEIVTYLAAAL